MYSARVKWLWGTLYCALWAAAGGVYVAYEQAKSPDAGTGAFILFFLAGFPLWWLLLKARNWFLSAILWTLPVLVGLTFLVSMPPRQ